MNNITLDMTEILAKAAEKAKHEAEIRINSLVVDMVNTHFRSPHLFPHNTGLAYELIERKIENYITSEEFADKIAQYAINAADEAANNTIKIVMNKLSRKLTFSKLNEIKMESK